ncbi:hypothetical protein [Hymenobacter rubripertinctus]|uniref:Uncharacterized protein n=1 Tax=Hymenobacter rubripertinctus TaxID=2029981 RepID=A0A418R648_9BACT|nr:hypothetical protein [Hymenobacter rubripertinctus]RIY12831.1 hypothetical protein D0T11_03665 [Hymenobacter rubripertinctus]
MPDQENKILQGLYDTLFSAITYSPGSSQPSAFDPTRTLIQFSKLEAIRADDFANQLAPNNPKGNYNTAYNFFALADTAPPLTPTYEPTTGQVSQIFSQIVNGANTDAQVDPAQQKTYDENFAYLNQNITLPPPPPGNDAPGPITGPTPIAQAYDTNQTAYIAAVSTYRLTMNSYDLTTPEGQSQWNAKEPVLGNAITQAWNKWIQGGKANVEIAQNALAATINNIISAAIAGAQQAVSPANQLSAGSNKFFMTYPLPSDWANPNGSSGATQFTYNSAVENSSSDSDANTYGGGGSFGAGLWSVGGSYNHSDSSTQSHFDGTWVKISATMTLVRIMRPWLNSLLFSIQGWWLTGQAENSISDGQLDEANAKAMLPVIPTAFVVMNNVQITSDFSTKDESHIASATSGSASVGWGPFSISASYSHSESHDRQTATYANGTITIPGMQIVAWVNEIMPASPSMTAPKKASENIISDTRR